MDEIIQTPPVTIDNEKKKLGIGWKILIVVGLIVCVWLVIAIVTNPVGDEDIILKDGMNLSVVECDDLTGNYLFYSPGCPHCLSALANINESQKIHNINYSITYLDITDSSVLSFVNEKHIIIASVPTLIAKCNVYVGEKDIEEYYRILS